MKKSKSSSKNKEVSNKLAHFMADSFVVYMKTLNFHWNMVGDGFFMYHKLLEAQYQEMQEGIDTIAERIRQLGFQAPGSMNEILSLTCLKESGNKISQAQMIQLLVKDNEALVEHGKELIDFTDEQDDQGSSDLLIDRMRVHDKNAWMLRSHFTK